jgi:cell division protein FtsX
MLASGIIALGIVLEVLLWAVQAVRMIISAKKQEYRVLELYGASARIIERNI